MTEASTPNLEVQNNLKKRQHPGSSSVFEQDCNIIEGEEVELGTTETKQRSKITAPLQCSSQRQPNKAFSPELLGIYYAKYFPYDLMYSWLSYEPPSNPNSPLVCNSHSKLFSHREFSFTILADGEEIYIRYQSFQNAAQLASAIQKRRPIKIDIGAVFSIPPKDKHAYSNSNVYPTQREFVFDIDLTDYDSVRKCGCVEAQICNKCWVFIGLAIQVLQRTLKEDFGFEHIIWFYSGRRGVHAWVCDQSARNLPNNARAAITSYIEIMQDNVNNAYQGGLSLPLHPMLKKAYVILEKEFLNKVCENHCLLNTPEACREMLKTLPDIAKHNDLLTRWSKDEEYPPQKKWNDILSHLRSLLTNQTKKNKLSHAQRTSIELWKYQTVFRYTYPRLDVNVSKMQNHLLKSPFCIHPKTGRVCVPIDNVEQFDPFAVPTLADVCESQGESLKDCLNYFQDGFLTKLKKSLWREEKERKEVVAAISGDF